MTVIDPGLRRSGFWRRVLSSLIDGLCIGIPFSLLAGVVFSVSHGTIQTASPGLRFAQCQPATSYPSDLNPSPPEASNFAYSCRIYSLGGQTGYLLTVGKHVSGNGYYKNIDRSYLLGPDNNQIKGIDISWVQLVLFFCYLFISLRHDGRTLGLKLTRSRLLTIADPSMEKVSALRILVRYAVMFGGFAPSVLLTIYLAYQAISAPDDVPPSGSGTVWALLLAAIWAGSNIILIARKQDPIYDRVAGTALVRH